MKLKDIMGAIGLRSANKVYGFEVETFDLNKYGKVSFAQWRHPKCRRTVLAEEAVDEIRRYVSPGDAVIDIGAHTGDTSVLFAVAAGKQGRVFAVEPNRYVASILVENTKLNPSAAHIDVLPYAATKEDANIIFQYSDQGYCNGGYLDRFGRFSHGHFYPLEVEGRNIATEIRENYSDWLPRIRLIKTDTEGNDWEVIETMVDIIALNRPFIVAEVYKRTPADDRRAFLRYLQALDYKIFRSEPWIKLAAEAIEPDDADRWDHFDIFCAPV